MGAESYAECLETINIDLLQILGKSYIIQHCVAFLKNRAILRAYQTYVTDALKVIAENTAGTGKAHTLNMRFADLISEEKPEERTEQDIINSIKEKLRSNK